MLFFPAFYEPPYPKLQLQKIPQRSSWSWPLLDSSPHRSASIGDQDKWQAPGTLTTGGVLDSPVLVHYSTLASQAPISPPPTLPIVTQDLPQDTLSPNQILLSPISPEWPSNKIPPGHSTLLADLELDSPPTSPEPLCVAHSEASSEEDDPDCLFPAWRQWEPPFEPNLYQYQEFSPEPFLLHLKQPIDNDLSPWSAPPLSPSPRCSLLPEIDEDLDDFGVRRFPSSPSRRGSYASLPHRESSDDAMVAAASPNQHILSLPGSDVDDDLIDADLSSAAFVPPTPFSPSPSDLLDDLFADEPSSLNPLIQSQDTSLLLADDPSEFPGSSSPSASPEPFDLDMSLSIDDRALSDPDLKQLWDLRRRIGDKERKAKRIEESMSKVGETLWVRNEVRRIRKVERERGKEVDALLRLKLDKQPSSGAIPSLEHLVARMVLRRRDTTKPLANRKIGSMLTPSSPDYVPSSLSSVMQITR